MARLDRIEIEAFRGSTRATSIDLSDSKPIVLLFGENGTGKSSIVDAIDFVCNGNIGIKEARSSVRARHVPSLGRKPTDIRTKVICNGSGFSASLSGERVSTGGDGRPVVRVLRRDRLHGLVAAEPAERYRQLQEFVTIPQLNSSENALRDASLTSRRDYEAKTLILTETQSVMEAQWEDAGSPGETALTWAEGLKAGLPNELRKRQAKGRQIAEGLSNARAQEQELDRAQADLGRAKDELETARRSLDSAAANHAAGADHLIDVLQATLRYFTRADESPCPVCESPAAATDLRTRVEKRVLGLEALKQVSDKVRSLEQEQARRIGAVESTRKAFVASIRRTKGLMQTSPALPSGNVINWEGWPYLEGPDLDAATQDAKNLSPVLQAEAHAVEERIASLEKEAVRSGLAQGALGRFREAEKTATEVGLKASRLGTLLEIVADERKKHVDAVLDEISANVNDLYRQIHPGEPLGDLRFFLDSAQQGSLNVESTFAGTPRVPPQAYFSDSHLDTLGICLFLAVALRQPKPIVVLDDVLSSADAQHTDRIIDVLRENAGRFGQLILTTHFRPLLDRLKRKGADKTQIIELGEWSPEKGIRHGATKIRTEELRDILNAVPFDRQAAASKAGIFIEEVLERLSWKLRLRVPRAEKGQLTLGELGFGLSGKLEKALIATPPNGSPIPIGTIIRSIIDGNEVRNQVGCHFNFQGAQIPDNDVRHFCEQALQVAEAFFCSGCAGYPETRKGTHWACQCGSHRLEPLEVPR